MTYSFKNNLAYQQKLFKHHSKTVPSRILTRKSVKCHKPVVQKSFQNPTITQNDSRNFQNHSIPSPSHKIILEAQIKKQFENHSKTLSTTQKHSKIIAKSSKTVSKPFPPHKIISKSYQIIKNHSITHTTIQKWIWDHAIIPKNHSFTQSQTKIVEKPFWNHKINHSKIIRKPFHHTKLFKNQSESR